MKKSSILTKIMLALVLCALVFALVACGDKEPEKKPDPKPPVVEQTLGEQVAEILNGVNPLLSALNEVKADGTLGAELSLAVDYSIGGTTGAHALAVKANANKKYPEAQISYKLNSTEYLNLTYKEKKVYLVQPVTTINETRGGTDGTVSDVSALSPSIEALMGVAMDTLAGLDGIELPAGLGASIDELLSGDIAASIGELIKIEKTSSGYSLVLGGSTINTVSGLLPLLLGSTINGLVGEKLGGDIMGAIQNFLVPDPQDLTKCPELSIKVSLTDKAISGIGIGYKKDQDTAGIDIGVKLATSAVNVTAPSAKNMAVNVGLGAELAQKGVNAALELYGAADLSADLNNLAYGSLDINGNKSHALFNGQHVVFNTDAIYGALNGGANNALIQVPANTTYKATIQETDPLTGLVKLNDGTPVTQSIVSIINNAVADWTEGLTAASADAVAPSKGITHVIYELIGGEATLNSKGDAYVEITEKAMMAQLKSVIGDYVRFTIDDASNEGNYLNTVKRIIALLEANDEWLIGGNVIKADFATNVTAFTDFFMKDGALFDFSNWIDTTATANGGIFDWDTVNYDGGIVLSKPEANNDLLDAVNVFAALGKEGDVYTDVTAEVIADAVNYYIAALGYYTGKFDEGQIAAIDAIDMEYDYAKAQYYIYGNLTAEEFETAKKAHKTALEEYYSEAIANEIIGEILGVSYADDGVSYIEHLINDGIYLHLGAVKDAGINGYIEIAKDKEITVSYAKISAHFRLVDNTINAQVTDANLDVDNAVELFAPEQVLENDADSADYKVIAELNGVKDVRAIDDGLGGISGYEYVYEEGYSHRYTAAEGLLDNLLEAAKKFFEYEKAAA